MTEDEILNALSEVFQEVLSDDTIRLTPATVATDIAGWDSFNHLLLMLATDKRFRIKLSTGDIESVRNVGDLVKVIQTRVSRQGAT